MTREELLTEIAIIKHKLSNGSIGAMTQQSLTIALIALYDCLVQMDNELVERSATSWEAPIQRSVNTRKVA